MVNLSLSVWVPFLRRFQAVFKQNIAAVLTPQRYGYRAGLITIARRLAGTLAPPTGGFSGGSRISWFIQPAFRV
jgi:hypothetical protein